MTHTMPAIEWIPDGPYPLGKYATLRDEQLWEIGGDPACADDYDGNVEAPTGWFALLIVTDAEIPAIRAEYGRPIVGIVGFHVLLEDSNGFCDVQTFAIEADARIYFGELRDAYSAWVDDAESFLTGEL